MTGSHVVALLVILAASGGANAGSAPLPSAATVVDRAAALDGESEAAIRRVADAVARSGGPRVSLVTIAGAPEEPIAAYASRVRAEWHERDRRRKRPADDWVIVAIAPATRRVHIEQGSAISAPLSAAQLEVFERRVFEPALTAERPDRALVDGTIQLLLALGADPVDVADPYRARTDWGTVVSSFGMLASFFGSLIGTIIYVLRADARAKRERALEAAGLIPPGTAFQGPDTEPIEESPLERGVPRTTFIVPAGASVALVALLCASGRKPWWVLAMWSATAATWAWLGVRVFRVAPLRSAFRDDEAIWIRPVHGVIRALVRPFLMWGMLLVVILTPPKRPDMALVGVWLAIGAVTFLALIANACVSYRASPEALEQITFPFRKRRRLAWREINDVWITSPPYARSIMFGAGVTRLARLGVPVGYEGVGDLAELVLRYAPADAIDRHPGTRASLDALAHDSRAVVCGPAGSAVAAFFDRG